MKVKYLIILIVLLFNLSCKNKKESPAFYDYENTESNSNWDVDPITNQSIETNDLIKVAFREENGVKYVKTSINGFGFEMIFDTGCSTSLISAAEANYLYEKGYLKAEDFLGTSQSSVADGRIVDNMVINLKEVIIDDKIICIDVKVLVSSNSNAPLLLGNEILNRVASYTIDNENETINFKLK